MQDADHYMMTGAYAGDTSRFRLKTGGEAGVTTTLISTGGQLAVDQWSFVTFTYDGMAMRIYNDGQLVAQPIVEQWYRMAQCLWRWSISSKV